MIRRWSPPQLIVAGFALLIAFGTLLLRLPQAAQTGRTLRWTDALFTATSAVSVTGLSTINVHDTLSPLGDVILVSLVQVGGIGIMSITLLALLLVGRRLSVHSLIAVRQELGDIGAPRMVARMLGTVAVMTIAIEAAGALIIFGRLVVAGEGLERAMIGSLVSITAFCNAGFDVLPRGLAATYTGDIAMNAVLCVLIVLGGLGFPVLAEMWTRRRRATRRRLGPASISMRLVLRTSAVLIAVGVGAMLAMEWSNPATLGGMSVHDRLVAGTLSGITPRTAGFETVHFANMGDGTLLVTMLLMFVGAGPVSTSGGIKVTTLALIVLLLRSQVRGRMEPVVFGRTLPIRLAGRALAVTAFAGAAVLAGTLLLIQIDDLSLLPALFESVSAFSTTGLSLDVTTHLSTPSRLIVAALMFTGRVAPATIVVALVRRGRARGGIEYPEEEIALG